MEVSIKVMLGILQAEKLLPELLKVCENKKVAIINRQFTQINYLQGVLTGTLIGDNANYVWGFMDGYGVATNLNIQKKKAPSK